MKLAVTGCNGSVGRRVVINALEQGHTVLGMDNVPSGDLPFSADPRYTFLEIDLRDFDNTLEALKGCEGIAHLAAFPNPTDYRVKSHNGNVVINWNILQACAEELGITRIAQASTVNVITLVYSQGPKFDYFPIDENHTCLPDEPYGLSKVIAELQADTIVRRHPTIRIASLRLHWSIPTREKAQKQDPVYSKNDLWGWVQEDSAAEAFLLAITQETDKWRGHERFFIAAPTIAHIQFDAKDLREKYWPDVKVLEGKDVSGSRSFFDGGKAVRLLGWVHRDTPP